MKKSKDDTTGGSEWTEEEKSSLSDALKMYDLVQYVYVLYYFVVGPFTSRIRLSSCDLVLTF